MFGLTSLTALLFSLCALVRGSLVDDVVSAIENAASCGACHALLIPLQGVARTGDSAFMNIFTEVCKRVGVEDEDVCSGVLQEQGPVLAQVLRSISPLKNTSTKFCNSLLGLCQSPAVIPYKIPFPKPAPTNPKSWVSKGNAPFKVGHFSDAHIDRAYTVGSDAVCKKPICCRNYTNNTKVTTPAGPEGSLHCDTPPSLVHSMLQSLPSNTFSIFTGDVVEAAVWSVNETHNVNDMQLFNNEMQQYLKSPVYPAIGNHEAAPVNLFPRNTTSGHASDAQWVFDTQAAGWTPWLDSTATSQIHQYSGSYGKVVPGTNLRIISINTVYWYKLNFWLFDSDEFQPDPNGIIGFTVQQLQEAEDAGQRAWIIGHMPPGSPDALWDQSNYFDQVVQRYKNTIAGQFYGHSHLDQFQIAYSDYSKRTADNAVNVAMIAPSLTPRNGNPAFKVYDVDPDTYELMDIHVYSGDVTSASFQTNPTWNLYYSVRATYGPLANLSATEALTPSFWHRVTEAFETNDKAFQNYNTFLSRGVEVIPCTGTCRATTICGLRALRAENNCVVTTPGTSFKRSDESFGNNSAPRSESCEGTSVADIFGKLPAAFAQAKSQNSTNFRDIFAKHIRE